MINYSIYKAQLAAIYSRHIWLTITVTTHCSLGADKPRYHRRSLATFSTIGSHRMPISLSLSLLSCSFTKPMNPMEVTPSEFDRHPWGVCRWFKTLGACNVSPIEQVRCTKVPYRIYIYIYTTGFQRLFAWRPRFKTRQSRASVAQDRWVMVERFELLPRVDVCMNHWPIFIAIFIGSRLSADYLSENRWKTG